MGSMPLYRLCEVGPTAELSHPRLVRVTVAMEARWLLPLESLQVLVVSVEFLVPDALSEYSLSQRLDW